MAYSIQNLNKAKKILKKKTNVVKAIPMTPIALGKGPVAIFPPHRRVKSFFDKIGDTIEIKSEKLSQNFWATSGTMASFYEILKILSLRALRYRILELSLDSILQPSIVLPSSEEI